ncbi:hypothetical protein [Phytohabitans kaempferiae]|uniref:CopC domain-containing protein n=1 Tax=Phytohabitans kaempferiae TaxID=1620943 RepID=A0ABV6MG42_9ACTN
MPPIARLVPAAAAVVLLAAGCGGDADEPPAAAPATSGAAPAASPSPSLPAASTPAARRPHILVFTVTGTAPVTSLTYVLDGKSTKVGAVKLPWRLPVDVPADGLTHEWSLTVDHGKGSVEALAIFNGAVTARTQGQTSGTGTASTGGSVQG